MVGRSLDIHAHYYRMLGQLLDDIAAGHPRFVLLDVHSYNHRRDGPGGDADSTGRGARHQHRHILDAAREWAFLSIR